MMEYADGGDLSMLIKRQAQMQKYFSESEVLLWFVQICLALWHVHSRGFLHSAHTERARGCIW